MRSYVQTIAKPGILMSELCEKLEDSGGCRKGGCRVVRCRKAGRLQLCGAVRAKGMLASWPPCGARKVAAAGIAGGELYAHRVPPINAVPLPAPRSAQAD